MPKRRTHQVSILIEYTGSTVEIHEAIKRELDAGTLQRVLKEHAEIGDGRPDRFVIVSAEID